jgi:hypothetical protein
LFFDFFYQKTHMNDTRDHYEILLHVVVRAAIASWKLTPEEQSAFAGAWTLATVAHDDTTRRAIEMVGQRMGPTMWWPLTATGRARLLNAPSATDAGVADFADQPHLLLPTVVDRVAVEADMLKDVRDNNDDYDDDDDDPNQLPLRRSQTTIANLDRLQFTSIAARYPLR